MQQSTVNSTIKIFCCFVGSPIMIPHRLVLKGVQPNSTTIIALLTQTYITVFSCIYTTQKQSVIWNIFERVCLSETSKQNFFQYLKDVLLML